MAKAAANNVVRPDLLTVDGKGVEVVSASWLTNKFRAAIAQMIDHFGFGAARGSCEDSLR